MALNWRRTDAVAATHAAVAAEEDGELASLLSRPHLPAAPAPGRVASLDQFRGWVVLTLLTIPVIGCIDAMPSVFRHNGTYFSLADAIMPQFYVAVGYAMQLTLTRVAQTQGFRAMVSKQVRRSGKLLFVSLLYYGIDGFASYAGPGGLQESWWTLFEQLVYGATLYQSLTLIALGQILLLPVIGRPWHIRLGWFVLLHAAYALGDFLFWFELLGTYIDGGSFGALSWATVMLVGTFLDDWHRWATGREHEATIETEPSPGKQDRRRPPSPAPSVAVASAALLAMGIALMAAGVGLSAVTQEASPACFEASASSGSGAPDMFTAVPCLEGAPGVVNWPFVPPPAGTPISIFTLSQPAGSNTAMLFGAGWAIPTYLVCFLFSDVLGRSSRFLGVLSNNALLLYILCAYGTGFNLANALVPADSPAWLVIVSLPVALTVSVVIAYFLENNNIHLRL